MLAGFLQIDVERRKCILDHADYFVCILLLLCGELLHDQNPGAIGAELPDVLKCCRQFIDGGIYQVIGIDLRIQRQRIFIGNNNFES